MHLCSKHVGRQKNKHVLCCYGGRGCTLAPCIDESSPSPRMDPSRGEGLRPKYGCSPPAPDKRQPSLGLTEITGPFPQLVVGSVGWSIRSAFARAMERESAPLHSDIVELYTYWMETQDGILSQCQSTELRTLWVAASERLRGTTPRLSKEDLSNGLKTAQGVPTMSESKGGS